MDNWTSNSFGEMNASDYDAKHDPGTTAEAVERIAGLAKGPVLELAVGTGRIALPLAARGLDVTGLEISPEMVAELRKKPGGADMTVVMGDMADVAVEGQFDMIILVFNTLFNLTSQAAQVRCFQNVAKRLQPGGTFLVETFVPDITRFRDHQDVRLKSMDMGRLVVDAIQHDPLEQIVTHQRLHITNGDQSLVPLVMRYAYPPELDLMAELAGLRLVHRWGGWRGEDFDANAKMHVSVWEKPAD